MAIRIKKQQLLARIVILGECKWFKYRWCKEHIKIRWRGRRERIEKGRERERVEIERKRQKGIELKI